MSNTSNRLKGLAKMTIALISGHNLNFVAYSDSKESQNNSQLNNQINILGLGVAGVDYLATVAKYPIEDSKIRTTSLNVMGGGNCANSMTTIQRLSKGIVATCSNQTIDNESSRTLSTFLVTKVGSDEHGDFIKTDLGNEGINISHSITKSNIATGFVYVIVDQSNSTRTCIATPVEEEITKSEVFDLIRKNKDDLFRSLSLVHFDSRHTHAAYLLASFINQMNAKTLGEDRRVLMTIDVEKDRPPYLEKLLPLCHIVFTNQTFTASYAHAKSKKAQRPDEVDNCNNSFRLISCHTDRCNSSKWYSWQELHDTQSNDSAIDLVRRLSCMESLFRLTASPASLDELRDVEISDESDSSCNNIGMVVSTMGEQGSVLLQRGGFQQLNQGVGRAEGLAVLRDHAAGDSQALSLDDFAALVKNKAPLKADKYKLQTTNAKNPENIMEYDVVRCSAWPMKVRPEDATASDRDPSAEYVVDTTGAGDSYIGGFITAALLGWSPELCMLLATAVVAEKLQHVGSRKGLPTSQKLVDKLSGL